MTELRQRLTELRERWNADKATADEQLQSSLDNVTRSGWVGVHNGFHQCIRDVDELLAADDGAEAPRIDAIRELAAKCNDMYVCELREIIGHEDVIEMLRNEARSTWPEKWQRLMLALVEVLPELVGLEPERGGAE